VLADLDVAAETGTAMRGLVKSFPGIEIADQLKLELRPKTARQPILSGIEVIIEGS
jgi:hypothetical protein